MPAETFVTQNFHTTDLYSKHQKTLKATHPTLLNSIAMFASTSTTNGSSQTVHAHSHKFGRQAAKELMAALESISVCAADSSVVVSELNYNHVDGAIKRLNHALYQLDKCIVHIRVGLSDDPAYQSRRASLELAKVGRSIPPLSAESNILMEQLDVMRVKRRILKDAFTSLCEYESFAQSPIARLAAQQTSAVVGNVGQVIAQATPEINALKKNLEVIVSALKETG